MVSFSHYWDFSSYYFHSVVRIQNPAFLQCLLILVSPNFIFGCQLCSPIALFILSAKIPFPLTQRFRSMLQNGIDLSTVDVSYVSSRSWYVFLL